MSSKIIGFLFVLCALHLQFAQSAGPQKRGLASDFLPTLQQPAQHFEQLLNNASAAVNSAISKAQQLANVTSNSTETKIKQAVASAMSQLQAAAANATKAGHNVGSCLSNATAALNKIGQQAVPSLQNCTGTQMAKLEYLARDIVSLKGQEAALVAGFPGKLLSCGIFNFGCMYTESTNASTTMAQLVAYVNKDIQQVEPLPVAVSKCGADELSKKLFETASIRADFDTCSQGGTASQ